MISNFGKQHICTICSEYTRSDLSRCVICGYEQHIIPSRRKRVLIIPTDNKRQKRARLSNPRNISTIASTRSSLLVEIHAKIAFLFILSTILKLSTSLVPDYISTSLLILNPLTAIPLIRKLPPRWFHLNLSSICTCFWSAAFILWGNYLILKVIWGITVLHYTYRCFQLPRFKFRAKIVNDQNYLLIPTFCEGKLACTLLAEVAKWMIKTPNQALTLAFCSNLAIYGTILLKQRRFDKFIFQVYNITLSSFFVFYYLLDIKSEIK